jgi:hypothetical protein
MNTAVHSGEYDGYCLLGCDLTVLVYVCICASSLNGRQWTGSTKDMYTSVAWFTVRAHFTQRYPCTRSWVQGRTGLCKRIA